VSCASDEMALQKVGAHANALSGKGNDMNGLVTNSSIRPQDEVRLVDSLNRSQLFDSRICHLKILALSLLREIASAENTGECEGNSAIDLQAEVRRFETELIRSALIYTGGRQRQAARLLGTKVTTLNTKIKRYGIEV
jgi:transcriptional regulator with GAF, ATPase, and Fis domain